MDLFFRWLSQRYMLSHSPHGSQRKVNIRVKFDLDNTNVLFFLLNKRMPTSMRGTTTAILSWVCSYHNTYCRERGQSILPTMHFYVSYSKLLRNLTYVILHITVSLKSFIMFIMMIIFWFSCDHWAFIDATTWNEYYNTMVLLFSVYPLTLCICREYFVFFLI